MTQWCIVPYLEICGVQQHTCCNSWASHFRLWCRAMTLFPWNPNPNTCMWSMYMTPQSLKPSTWRTHSRDLTRRRSNLSLTLWSSWFLLSHIYSSGTVWGLATFATAVRLIDWALSGKGIPSPLQSAVHPHSSFVCMLWGAAEQYSAILVPPTASKRVSACIPWLLTIQWSLTTYFP